MKRALSFVLAIVLLASCFGQVLAAGGSDEITTVENDTIVPMLREEDLIQYAGEALQWVEAETSESPATRASNTVKLPFTDVPGDAWYYTNVSFVYELKLMSGVSSNKFNPLATLTRAELVTVLFRMEELYCNRQGKAAPTSNGVTQFTDVPENAYYAKAVAWANANGIVNGISSSEFGPNVNVTREQIATIFYRYYSKHHQRNADTSTDLSKFIDNSSLSGFAKSGMAWAVGSRLITGTSYNTLSPLDCATRAETAVLLERMYLLLLCDALPRTSQKLVNFLMEREGFAATPYWDVSQYSIGYGSFCGKTKAEVPAAYWDGITQAEAQILLKRYLVENYEPSVTNYEKRHKLSFSQQQFDALADFTYALGPLWTTGGYMLTDWLEHPASDMQLVYAMGSWCRVSGSVNTGTATRRIREAYIFLYGDYTGTATNHPQFCAVKFSGNGSYLTTKYTDDIGFYVVGYPYTDLPVPEYKPYSGSDIKVFNGWQDSKGKAVNNSTVATGTATLTARWQ